MPTRFYLETLGCPKNRVDTEVMLGHTADAGHSLVEAPEAADVIVVNTCGFIGEAKQESIEMDGVVTEVLPDRRYRVELPNGHSVLAYGAGKMAKFRIRVLEGDRVTLAISPYDLTKGRIVYRGR